MSAPLRIASLTTFYPPHNFGGDGIDVQRTARALARRGHQVTVIYSRDAFRALTQQPVGEPEPDPLVEVIGLESRYPRLSALLTHQVGRPVLHAATLRAIARSHAFDVVLFNNVSLLGGPGLLRFGGGDAVRVYIAHEHWLVCPTHVLWRHDREACTHRECVRCVLAYRRPPQLWRPLGALRRALPHVDAFVARSAFSRAKHLEYGFPRDMDVLPYVLPDVPDDSALPRPHPRPYFLYAGRLERIKGVDDLIHAVPGDLDADVLIAGGGEQSEALRQLAAGHPRITFVGRIDPDALAAYYRHALAVIVPTRGYETFGLVAAEALLHGAPVLVRRMGPLPEFIGRTGGGECFATREELATLLRRFAAHPDEARALGARGRERLRATWGGEVAVDALLGIIEQARQRRARSTAAAPLALPGGTA